MAAQIHEWEFQLRSRYRDVFSGRRRRFIPYAGKGPGDHYVMACDFSGGSVVTDKIDSIELAELIANLLNFAADLARCFEDGAVPVPMADIRGGGNSSGAA